MKQRRRLKVLRAEAELTQSKLARKAGLSHARYWQIENGEGSDPHAHEQRGIAAALGVAVSEIDWPARLEAVS